MQTHSAVWCGRPASATASPFCRKPLVPSHVRPSMCRVDRRCCGSEQCGTQCQSRGCSACTAPHWQASQGRKSPGAAHSRPHRRKSKACEGTGTARHVSMMLFFLVHDLQPHSLFPHGCKYRVLYSTSNAGAHNNKDKAYHTLATPCWHIAAPHTTTTPSHRLQRRQLSSPPPIQPNSHPPVLAMHLTPSSHRPQFWCPAACALGKCKPMRHRRTCRKQQAQ